MKKMHVYKQDMKLPDLDFQLMSELNINEKYEDSIAKIHVLEFNPSNFINTNSNYGNTILDEFLTLVRVHSPIRGDDHKLIKEGLLEINSISSSKGIVDRCRMTSIILSIMADCIGKFRANSESLSEQKIMKSLQNVFDYIDNNYMNEIIKNDIVKISGYSIAHFSRIFKEVSGRNFNDYLNLYRIDRSIEYILTGENITNSAFECGFTSISTFNRCFKKFKGVSAGVYKKNNIDLKGRKYEK